MPSRRQIIANPHTTEVCPTCGNIKYTDAAKTRAKKAGNASYLKSLQKGQLSMSDRGKLGGGRRKLTLAERDAQKASEGGLSPHGLGVPQLKSVPESILAIIEQMSAPATQPRRRGRL